MCTHSQRAKAFGPDFICDMINVPLHALTVIAVCRFSRPMHRCIHTKYDFALGWRIMMLVSSECAVWVAVARPTARRFRPVQLHDCVSGRCMCLAFAPVQHH